MFPLLILLIGITNAQDKSGLDLPITPPKLGGVIGGTEDVPIEPDDDDGDDPSDTPPPTFYGEEIGTETDTIFYVIDRSGSMARDLQAFVATDGSMSFGMRMDRAKNELSRSISGLSNSFKFNIIAYDCGIVAFSSSMVEATEPNKQAARIWISSLMPGGSTATGPATAVALGDKENRAVILLTDGEPNCGAITAWQHRTIIKNSNTQGAVINVFGISATGQWRAFCQGVASDSGGNYFDVP